MNPKTLRPLVAELTGTALFVFFGAGSIAATMAAAVSGGVQSMIVAAAHGVGMALAIFVCALVGGPFTGAMMNPARAFGPAIIAWQLTAQYVYWVGPLIGAALAGLLWKHLLLPKDHAKI